MENLVNIQYARTGASSNVDALGMREMQRIVYEARTRQYLLVKAPPASGKSRALKEFGRVIVPARLGCNLQKQITARIDIRLRQRNSQRVVTVLGQRPGIDRRGRNVDVCRGLERRITRHSQLHIERRTPIGRRGCIEVKCE